MVTKKMSCIEYTLLGLTLIISEYLSSILACARLYFGGSHSLQDPGNNFASDSVNESSSVISNQGPESYKTFSSIVVINIPLLYHMRLNFIFDM